MKQWLGKVFNQKEDVSRWQEAAGLAALGLFIYILVQNDSNASSTLQSIISTIGTTLQSMLTGSYGS